MWLSVRAQAGHGVRKGVACGGSGNSFVDGEEWARVTGIVYENMQ
jgi:hypothetical protein